MKGMTTTIRTRQMLLTLVLTCMSITALGQEGPLPMDSTTHKVSYSGIVDAAGAPKESLFDNAKKWILTQNSKINPYTISYENETDGSVIAKGTFILLDEHRNFTTQFTITISVKDSRYKYDLSDFILQYKTEAGSHVSGYGMWSHATQTEAETLEYSLETFYPSRMHSRKPSIKWYEDIDRKSFELLDKIVQPILGSLKQTMAGKSDW